MTVSTWRRVTAKVLLVVLLGNPLLGVAWGAERASSLSEVLKARLAEEREALKRAAEQAAVGNQSGVRTNANGVTFINIATPSARGVSHNRFEQFNVPEAGVVLNNSQGPALSVLGGWSDGNRYLAGGTASLILTEVTGTGVSSLLGYTEVLGDSAEFVLANPNGIHCDGCGFINTPRVTFATGSALMQDGALQGFHIGGGRVVIEGAGLNASQVSKFDILSRAMSLNAALYANELNIVTGVNDVDYATGVVRAAEGVTAEPGVQFALDASALGAMYANRIRLIGTEAGLGVRSDGLIQATEALTLSADGQIVLKDALAGQPLALESRSGGVTLNGTVYGSEVSVSAKDTVINNGTLGAAGSVSVLAATLTQQGDILAGVDSEGQWQDGGQIQLNVTGELNNRGRIISQGAQSTVQINSGSLHNQQEGAIQSQSLIADTGQLTNSGLLLADTLTLTADTLENRGQLQGHTITLTAAQLTQHEGTIYQQGAPSAEPGQLRIDATTLTTSGGVVVSEGEAIIQSQRITQGGDWLLGGASTISTEQLTNSGTLQFLSSIALQSDLLNNSGQLLFMGSAPELHTELNISTRLTNSGLLQFNSADVNLTLPELINAGGQLYHLGEGAFTLNATLLDNQSGELASAGALVLTSHTWLNRQGAVQAERLAIVAETLDNQQGQVLSEGELLFDGGVVNNQQGVLVANGRLQLTSEQLDNTDGTLAASFVQLDAAALSNLGQGVITGTQVQLRAGQLQNSGVIEAQQLLAQAEQLHNTGVLLATGLQGASLVLSADTLLNQGQIESRGEQMVLQGLSFTNEGGQVRYASTGALQLAFEESISNQGGVLYSEGSIALSSMHLNNRLGQVVAERDLTLHAGELNNAQGMLYAGLQMAIEAEALGNQQGKVFAGTGSTLQLDTLDNTDGQLAVLQQNAVQQGTLRLQARQVDNLGGGVIQSAGALDIQAAMLNNAGAIEAQQLLAQLAQLQNTGHIQSEQLQLNAQSLQNQGQVLFGTGELQAQQLDNLGVIAAGNNDSDAVIIRAATLQNQGKLIYQGGDTLQLEVTDTLDNQQGQILSRGQLQLQGGVLQNDSGLIEVAGQAQMQLDHYTSRGGQLLLHGIDNQLNLVSLLLQEQAIIHAARSINITGERIENRDGGIQAQQLMLNAAQLDNQGQILATTLDITATQADNAGILQAQQLSVSAAELNNSGSVIASSTADNSLQLQLDTLINQGVIASAATNWQLELAELDNDGGQLLHQGSGHFSLTQQAEATADFANSGIIASGGTLSLEAQQLRNQGTVQGGELSLNLAGLLDNREGTLTSLGNGQTEIRAGSINNAGGTLQAQTDVLSLTTDTILNNQSGTIVHSGTDSLTLNASQLQQQQGAIHTGGMLIIDTAGTLDNREGTLQATQYQLISGTLDNTDGTISASGNAVSRITTGALDNTRGLLAANGSGLAITAGMLTNNQGNILQAGLGVLSIDAITLTNSSTDLGKNGRIIGNGAVDINLTGALQNSGLISAAQLLDIDAATVTNSGNGLLGSRAGAVVIDATTLTNSATISGVTATTLTTNTLNNQGGYIQSDGTVILNTGQLTVGNITGQNISATVRGGLTINSQEQIQATNNLVLNTLGSLTNSGNIVGGNQLLLNSTTIDNLQGGTIKAGSLATLTTDTLTNHGTIGSGHTLNLNLQGEDSINHGTIAANNTLNITGDIDNTNLLYAGKQLTMTGNLFNLTQEEGLASVYSGGNLQITGGVIFNQGGSIAAADDLSLSGKITNSFSGELKQVPGTTTTRTVYVGINPDMWGAHEHKDIRITTKREDRVITVYENALEGTQGRITSGRDMRLNGNIINEYGEISVGGNLDISGEDFAQRSAQNQTVTQATVYEEVWGGGCHLMVPENEGRSNWCAEPDSPPLISSTLIGPTDPTFTYHDGALGSVVVAGDINGNLKQKVELTSNNPLAPNQGIVRTDVETARGEVSRGSAGTAVAAYEQVLSIRSGNNITLTDGVSMGDGALGSSLVGSSDIQLDGVSDITLKTAAGSTIEAGQLAQALSKQTDTVEGLDKDAVAKAETDTQVTATFRHESLALDTPYHEEQIAQSGSLPNTDATVQAILKNQTDNHSGIIAEHNLVLQAGSNISIEGSSLSAGNAPVGQNVFMTDEQIRVLTEDLGFNADDINKGQQALYSAISLNDLLPDGVTLSAGGIIDIYAAEGMRIDAGVYAGEGLVLRTDGGLQTKDTTFLDSDKFIGLQIGSDFTNNMALNSDELWLDIGGSFTNSGSMAGGVIDISAGKDMHNLGSLAGTHIGVNAGGNLLNTGSMIADGLLNLKAGEDLINRGGHLEGNDVLLKAGGDIINRTEYQQYTYTDKNGNSRTNTFVGPSSDIISHNNLSMDAGHNVDLQGSKLAAANNIDITAGNDVLLGAIENLSGHEKYFKGGHDIEVNRTYDVVSMDAGNNLSIRAGNNIESEGAQFSAGNIASLIAENEMNLLAVVESHYDADKTTKKSTFSKRVTETVSLHEEVQGTVINAGTILLNAEVGEDGQVVKAASGDITLVGGELNADNDIIAFGKDITITAGTYQDYEYSHTSKSSFGGLKSKSQEDLAQDVLLSGSTVSAGGTVLLDAESNIAIISSDLKGQDIGLKAFDDILIASGEESRIRESRSQSGGFLSGGSLYSASEAVNGTIKITANSASVEAKGNLIIEAGSATVIGSTLDADGGIKVKTDIGDIQILAARETEHSYEYRKELNVGLGDMFKMLSDPAGMLKDTYDNSKESGRISITIANADYLESETSTDITRHKGSEITAAKGITFDSIGNINIEGGYVDADKDGDDEGALRLKAGGNIRVADVTDTFSQNSKTTSGSAQVNAMVTHQAVEVANAAIAVKDATDQLEQTRRNYKAWEQQQDTLKQQLAKLESELAQGKPGVTRADIDDLRTQIDILSTDEAWHLANISVATYNLATATENLYHQSVAAYNSGATYGFNAGMELNLNAQVTESQVQESYSVGSYLSGAGVSFETGEDGTLEIAGSWVDSTKDMTLDVGNLVMSAGKNTHDSQTQSKQGNLNISQTVWGAAAGGPAISGSLNLSEERNHSTTYTNAGLIADGKMTINVKGDAELIGATVHADEGLSATIGGDLTVTSVQDIAYGSNKGIGVSGGVSFGGKFTNEGGADADNKTTIKTTALGETTGAQSANGGISLENGRYFSKETVLSGITSGGTTDITVGGHTALNGALIANVDENGQDTGQLTLNTKGLSFTDLTNTYYSSNSSLSLSTSVMLGDTPVPAKPELTGVTNQPEDSKGGKQPSGTTSVGIHQDSSYGKGKTLATIGNGTIIVGGEETEPEGLNRDVDAVDKELYSIERTKGDLDLTVQNKTLEKIADAFGISLSNQAGLIEAMGVKLDGNLQEQLGQSGEQVVIGMMNEFGMTAEEVNNFLLANPKLVDVITGLKAVGIQLDNPEQFTYEQLAAQMAQVAANASQQVNNNLNDQYGLGESYVVKGVIMPLTPVQAAAVAIGQAQRYLVELSQTNPQAAEMASLAISMVSGGPVKGVVGYVANKGIEAFAGDALADIENRASSYIGYLVAGNYNTVGDFDDDAAVYDGFNNAVKDAGTFVLNNMAGVGVGKKSSVTGNNAVSNEGKTYQTYTKTNPDTGVVYCGRTSGCGTAEENIARRDANHHMNQDGFGPAVLDKSSDNSNAIRGREQLIIDNNGGAQSVGGTSGNKYNGISPKNPKKEGYIDAAKRGFED